MPSREGNRIVLIGAVAGGMSCATRLRRLNESLHITVIERERYIHDADYGTNSLTQSPEMIKSWFNIDVLTHVEVLTIDRDNQKIFIRKIDTEDSSTGSSMKSIGYDKLVIAAADQIANPTIQGLDLENVFRLQAIADLQKIQHFIYTHNAKRMAIIGAGSIGLEAANRFVDSGMSVTVLENGSQVMPFLDKDIAAIIQAELERNDVNLFLNTRVFTINEQQSSNTVLLSLDEHGRTMIPADIVVYTAGLRASMTLAESAGLAVSNGAIVVNDTLQTSDPSIYAIGDSIETPNRLTGKQEICSLTSTVSRQGRLVADHICGRSVRYLGHIQRELCKVFGLTVGRVGISGTELERMERVFVYVTVQTPDHAGHDRDASSVTLRVAFETSSGKLLGAQSIAVNGADLRIDVLATAIQAGMTIEDLAHLELTYVLPHGPSNDPVNMVGYVGSNLITGDLDIMHFKDLMGQPSGIKDERSGYPNDFRDYQILDVRTIDEYESGHLPHAINIPIVDLRRRIQELSKERPTLVYCAAGYRGYLGYRILKQLGFNVINLDGGIKMVSEGGFKHVVLTTREESEFGC
jgi:NADPH-dependent 2,4-dienoyl-CoA reductase/sulfur reductase-like enzyme/rhodanese-related sulfurtransferase